MNNIGKYINQYIQDFIGNGIYDLIKFLLGLFITAIVGSGIVFKILNFFIKDKYLAILIIGFGGILFSVAFILMYKKIKKI